MDNAGAISTMCAGHRLDGFDVRQKQRNEDDVQPDGREHQRPERCPSFPRLHHRRKTEMTGDHGRSPSRARTRPGQPRIHHANHDYEEEDTEDKLHVASPRAMLGS